MHEFSFPHSFPLRFQFINSFSKLIKNSQNRKYKAIELEDRGVRASLAFPNWRYKKSLMHSLLKHKQYILRNAQDGA
jgi:hypothetical protein